MASLSVEFAEVRTPVWNKPRSLLLGKDPCSFIRFHKKLRRFEAVRSFVFNDSQRKEREIRTMSLMATDLLMDRKKLDEEAPKLNGNMDGWIRGLIVEVVKNIGEAPLLLYVDCEKKKEGASRIRVERVNEEKENWNIIRKRVEKECLGTSDAVVLVKEITLEPCGKRDNSSSWKVWGLLVQKRGMNTIPSCYILNTSRVQSSGGFCTHFSLSRAQCFGDSVEMQLRNSWLHSK